MFHHEMCDFVMFCHSIFRVIKEYDLQIKPKKKDKKTPGVINESPGSEYNCGDMDKWTTTFQDKKAVLKKLKPIIESMKSWIGAFAGNKFWSDVEYCIDLILFWCNELYQNNNQPNFGKALIEFWKSLCEAMDESYCAFGEIDGKFLLPIVCTQAFGTKQTTEMAHELCEMVEHLYPPAICYKIYLTTIEKNKNAPVRVNCMKRLAKATLDYGT